MAKILINKDNLFYNLNIIIKQAGSIDKVAVVLKDNAYGHGLMEIASLAKEFGIKKAVAKTVHDAIKIEKYFDYILILTETTFQNYSHNFHIALNSFYDIKKLPNNCNVHVKVDTGMHRNGIQIEDLEDAFLGLSKKNINITGVFTHHKGADELTNDFFLQNTKFLEVKNLVKNICEKLFLPLPLFHSCNSSALFRTPNFNEDLARIGIATYGYLNNEDFPEFPKMKPVLSLWGKKISTRILKKDETVGYGGKFKASDDMVISTYDVGYGDGFLRLNERKMHTTPKGYKVLGKVSMDYLSLNTDENEVCIFDNAIDLAKVHDTITYEIVTTLNPNIEKEIV